MNTYYIKLFNWKTTLGTIKIQIGLMVDEKLI